MRKSTNIRGKNNKGKYRSYKQAVNTKTSASGITLIALIVTIIVLIILAGISINLVLGENGIIKKAQEAKEEATRAEMNEKYELAEFEDAIEEAQTGIQVQKVTDINPGVLEGTGTEVDPYIINSIEDLVVFSYKVREGNNYEGEFVKLGLDLDFNSTKSYVEALRTDYSKYGYDGELKTKLTTGEGFIPIGTYPNITDDSGNDITKSKSFAGIFDGNNKSINGLHSIKGLFGFNYGTIENLTIKGEIVDAYQVGALCFQNYGNIIKCKNYVNVDSDNNSGGIVAVNRSTGIIRDSYNYGNVTGTDITIGGISGFNQGVITYCTNKGTIINTKYGYEGNTGGIAGSNGGEISYSYNNGNVYSDSNLCGGICGINNKVIKYCFNDGLVSSSFFFVGGICGYSYTNDGNISFSYNIGDITGKDYTGGIIGCLKSGTSVKNCYSKCKIQASNAGGICGEKAEDSTISDCEWYTENLEYGIASSNSNENATKNANVYIPKVEDII